MNMWDEKFKASHFVYGTEPNAFLKEYASVFDEASAVACFAEGEGRNAVFLAGRGKRVTAYDYAKEGLEKTRQLAQANSVVVETKLADLLQDELVEAAYDGAVMIFGHFAKEDQYHVLDKIMGSLKPGGVFLLEVYEDGQLAYNTGGPRALDFLYNEQQLLEWAQQFEVKHFYCGEVERHEGELHTGLCKVLQLVVRKIEKKF